MPTIATGGDTPLQTNSTAVINEPGNIVNTASTTETVPPSDTTETANAFATPTIVNHTVPVVVFVGPPTSGKSMILVRLAKYLRAQGYAIKTDPTFLNTSKYLQGCKDFEDSLNTVKALPGTVEYLLVDVYLGGNLVAKLLEAPGEDFYTTNKNRKEKNSRVEAYLATIMASNNPKSYVTLLDLDSVISFRRDNYHRDSYSQRFLNYFYPAINKKRDKIILLYNKIDMTPFGDINGCNNYSAARNDAELYYPQLFSSLKVSKLGGFITVDNFTFLTFCTGMFSSQTDSLGNNFEVYNVASDNYPRDLWREITSKW